jgi:hypothetical protein
MNYRVPTFQELFPSAHKVELIKQQSEYFVNKSLSKGGPTEGLKGIPTAIPVVERFSNAMPPNDIIAGALVGTYFKNNWKVMLTCAIVGGVLIYVLIKIDEENQKIKTKK